MRVATVDGVDQDIGTLIGEDDNASLFLDNGIEVREIPIERGKCHSTTWISRDGFAVQRNFNAWSETWSWSDPKAASLVNDDLTIYIGSGTYRQKVRIVRAIALAWISHPKGIHKCYTRLISPGNVIADNIGWIRLGVKSVTNIRHVDELPVNLFGFEEWAPLVILRCDDNEDIFEHNVQSSIHISDSGIIRNDGNLTRGYISESRRRYVPIDGVGIVWVDNAVMNSFRETSPSPGRSRIHHLDGNTLNNNLTNLEWRDIIETRSIHRAIETYEWVITGMPKYEIMKQQ